MILLDTHIVVWLAFEPDKLSKHAQGSYPRRSPPGRTCDCGNFPLELAWLAEKRRVETTLSVESFVRLCASKMTVLPITPEIAARAVSFPDSYPKDPQDRLIGATALVGGIELVTHDKSIKKSGLVPVIW